MLVLSDGSTIELAPETSLTSLKDGGASITNEKMLLSYTSEEVRNRNLETVFNELKTPRGGGYNLQLADGTEVWLNAGSSIKFPVSFQDSVRQVILEGEAYFEVKHNGKPFIVSSANTNTRVLGTSFNISAYADDPVIKTTLVEGKVSVELVDYPNSTSARTILAPNEQATYIRSSTEISKDEVIASSYISWMRGKMEFHNENLETVMKRLARWYDFNYSFENAGAKEFHFSARLDKNESLSVILEMLEMTTDVKFEYKDNAIVVL
jgi:ferric-dicitrate binding protein FerR (iron transport regulator)